MDPCGGTPRHLDQVAPSPTSAWLPVPPFEGAVRTPLYSDMPLPCGLRCALKPPTRAHCPASAAHGRLHACVAGPQPVPPQPATTHRLLPLVQGAALLASRLLRVRRVTAGRPPLSSPAPSLRQRVTWHGGCLTQLLRPCGVPGVVRVRARALLHNLSAQRAHVHALADTPRWGPPQRGTSQSPPNQPRGTRTWDPERRSALLPKARACVSRCVAAGRARPLGAFIAV